MNIYNFTGRLARDCEIRQTQSGTSICSFTVAVDFGFGDNKGVNWIRCSIFGKRAEGALPQYLLKGVQVAIAGELRVREYDDNEGNKRTSVDVSVNTLDLIGGRQDGGAANKQAGGGNQQRSNAAPARAPVNNDPFANAPDFGDDDIPF